MSRSIPRLALLLLALSPLAGCAHAAAPAMGVAPGPPGPEGGAPATALVTGSRLPQRIDPGTGRPLTSSNLRVYSADQLHRTGDLDLRQALQQLDPGLR